jgi:hypothetical protein
MPASSPVLDAFLGGIFPNFLVLLRTIRSTSYGLRETTQVQWGETRFGCVEETFPCIWHDSKVGSGFVVGWCRFLQQQVDMYSTLIFALPENDLSIIENVSEDDKTCGHTAWTALVNHYEDDGICRCAESLQVWRRRKRTARAAFNT